MRGGFTGTGDSLYFIKTQMIAAVLGLGAMFIMIISDYKWLKHLALPGIIVAIVLLIAVLFIGTVVNDSRRWIYIGPINFQPSEIAKFAVILFFSQCISVYTKSIKTFWKGVVPYVAILGIITFLMAKEPHFSGAILICTVGMILVFVGGAAYKWFIISGTAGALAIGYVIMFTQYASYIQKRVAIWRNPALDSSGTGYQILQSLYAIGSGGIFGLGLGQSRQKYLYIPEPHNDFIFSIVCEELGFVGAIFMVILFALLLWRGYLIALKAPDKFSCMLVTGIISLVGVQCTLNIAVVTNTMPVTGMSLPFFSYGGTSLMILLAEMGIVLNISRYIVKGDGS